MSTKFLSVCMFVSRVGWVPGFALVPHFAWRTCPYLQRSPKSWIPSAPFNLQWCFRNPDELTVCTYSGSLDDLKNDCTIRWFINFWLKKNGKVLIFREGHKSEISEYGSKFWSTVNYKWLQYIQFLEYESSPEYGFGKNGWKLQN